MQKHTRAHNLESVSEMTGNLQKIKIKNALQELTNIFLLSCF